MATVDKVLGTRAEWIELGAPPNAWWAHAWLSPEDCRFWHDTSLATVIAGFIPPWRPKTYRTLKAPEFKDTPCQARRPASASVPA